MIVFYKFKERILQSRILLHMEVITYLLRKFPRFMENKAVRRSPTLVSIMKHRNPFNAFPPYFLKVNFDSSLEVCKSNRFMHFSFFNVVTYQGEGCHKFQGI